MSSIAVIWISSSELSYVCHTYAMPIYVLLCGPKIRNKNSCILYGNDRIPLAKTTGNDRKFSSPSGSEADLNLEKL